MTRSASIQDDLFICNCSTLLRTTITQIAKASVPLKLNRNKRTHPEPLHRSTVKTEMWGEREALNSSATWTLYLCLWGDLWDEEALMALVKRIGHRVARWIGVKTSRDNSTTYVSASLESTPGFIICAVVLSSLHLSIQKQWLFLNCSNTSVFKRLCCYNWNLCWRNFKARSGILGASHQ